MLSRAQLLFILLTIHLCGATVFAEDLAREDAVNLIQKIDEMKSLSGPHCEARGEKSGSSEIVLKDNELCAARASYLQDRLWKSQSLDSALSEIKSRNPDLIVIGESHGSMTQNRYKDLMASIKKKIPQIDCLFVEFAEAENEDIQKVAKGRGDITHYRVNLVHTALQTAEKLKVRIIPVDHPRSIDPTWSFSDDEQLNPRDEYMASQIERHLRTGPKKCKKGLFIVGSAHVTPDIPNRNLVVTRLDEKKIKLAKINFQSTGPNKFSKTLPASWYWSVCKDNPGRQRQAAVFRNTPAPKGVTFYESGHGSWTDFDFTVIYPYIEHK